MNIINRISLGRIARLFTLCVAAFAAVISFSTVQAEPSGSAKVRQPVLERAVFAGGCFWCMEQPFDLLPGVVSVTSGYTGGHTKNPTYKEVSAGGTGHAEAVQILYDPAKISYDKLLSIFWLNIDPTVQDRQFCDTGDQYRSGIFYTSDEQRRLALQSKKDLEKSKPFKEPIVTGITRSGEFYPAEEYHQQYYKKNPLRYTYYRSGCGRDKRLKELWGSRAGH